MSDQTIRVRPKRVPLGQRNKLTVDGLTDRDEYVYRWVNDIDGRTQACLDAGWTFVDKNGKAVGDGPQSQGVGTVMSKSVGNGVTGYLMKQDRKTWELDRKARVDDKTDALEEAMKKQASDKSQGRYGSVEIASIKR
jgi:hypothetical protein